jgi:hypothetical protein
MLGEVGEVVEEQIQIAVVVVVVVVGLGSTTNL